MEPARVVKVDVLQDKARQLGVSSEDIATTLNGVLAGSSITQDVPAGALGIARGTQVNKDGWVAKRKRAR